VAFTPAGGGTNVLRNSSGVTVGYDQSSYIVPHGTYTLITFDGFPANGLYELPINAGTPVTKYTVTLNGGGAGASGGGSYAPGATVTINAGTAPTGQTFSHWTAVPAVTFANANASSTTFVMPSNAVTLTANWKAITYALTVTNGLGSGNHAAGAVVNISANTPPSGKVFDKWTTTNGGTFANVNAASTTFTMPATATTVTATYKDAVVELATPVIDLAAEYPQGGAPIDLKMKGGSVVIGTYTFKVNGEVKTQLSLATKGTFVVEATNGTSTFCTQVEIK